jgi:hypothetical protein
VVLQYLPTYLTPGLLVPPPLPSVFPSWLTPHIPFPFTKSSLLLYQEVFLSPGINLIFDLKLFFAVLETESRASQVFYHLSYYIVFFFKKSLANFAKGGFKFVILLLPPPK